MTPPPDAAGLPSGAGDAGPDDEAEAPAAAPRGHPGLRLAWKIASITFGVALILVGIVGLFLPILQGVLMIVAGLAVLSPHSRRARNLLKGIKARMERKKPG